ncbi:hypothetical protein HYPSUDRAFT_914073 [Hypholoma sublateritium FD-334 SS-4]|uniref:Uncharacterized protein n=1 Tax=Hypholoma sublateritium (strain FD-334 SS-4) TaxID=945553 RepID=A0A0D2NPY3_HYPSF|nr:hypothetical protein HYPSUDRAFT_914073 [Hypholoma sublateritium FD-334 SS-4]
MGSGDIAAPTEGLQSKATRTAEVYSRAHKAKDSIYVSMVPNASRRHMSNNEAVCPGTGRSTAHGVYGRIGLAVHCMREQSVRNVSERKRTVRRSLSTSEQRPTQCERLIHRPLRTEAHPSRLTLVAPRRITSENPRSWIRARQLALGPNFKRGNGGGGVGAWYLTAFGDDRRC